MFSRDLPLVLLVECLANVSFSVFVFLCVFVFFIASVFVFLLGGMFGQRDNGRRLDASNLLSTKRG